MVATVKVALLPWATIAVSGWVVMTGTGLIVIVKG